MRSNQLRSRFRSGELSIPKALPGFRNRCRIRPEAHSERRYFLAERPSLTHLVLLQSNHENDLEITRETFSQNRTEPANSGFTQTVRPSH